MTKYNKKISNKIIELLKSDTYTIDEICSIVRIARRTFYDWQSGNVEFANEIEQAKEERTQFVISEAKKSLLRKIQGYYVYETRVVTVPSNEKDENGNPKPKIKEQTTTKKYIAPDTAAVIFTLTNGEPGTWRNRQTNEVTGKDGKDLFKDLSDEQLEDKIAELERKLDK